MQSRLRDQQVQASSTEEGLRQELQTLKKLTEVLRKTDQEKSVRLAEMKDNLNELEKQLSVHSREAADSADDKSGQIQALQQRIQELEQAKKALESRPRSSSPSSRSPRSGLQRAGRAGKTVTELYSDVSQAQVELDLVKSENAELKKGMQEIIAEVEQRSKHYMHIEEAYEQLVKEANELSEQLASTLREREDMLRQQTLLKSEVKQLKDDEIWFHQKNVDLSQQVQTLLVALEEEHGSLPPGTLAEIRASQRSKFGGHLEHSDDGAQSVISERLVAFRNIEELQKKNEELLQVVRKLSENKESEELELRQAELRELQGKYADAVAQLQTLVDERKKNEVFMKSVISERDMYRRMAQEQGGRIMDTPSRTGGMVMTPDTSPRGRTISPQPHVQQLMEELDQVRRTLTETQTSYEAFRNETAADSKVLQQQLQTAQREVFEFKAQFAQAKTQNEFLEGLNQLEFYI
jgi:nucleoprotein TPR